MMIEFFLEVFFIKIKIKGSLKNITENKEEIIDTTAIKKESIINYKIDNTVYKIKCDNNKVILSRNNEKYSNEIIFDSQKEYNSEYYIKDLNTSINIKIKTNYLKIEKDRIEIKYQVLDSNEEYLYLIEMSE